MGHWDRSRFGGEELRVRWICRISQDPLPASRSCHGNDEGKEGMEWRVSRESLVAMGWLPTGQTCGTLGSNPTTAKKKKRKD
jgi:hypothetical protein